MTSLYKGLKLLQMKCIDYQKRDPVLPWVLSPQLGICTDLRPSLSETYFFCQASPHLRFANMTTMTTRNLVLMAAAFAMVIALSNSVAAAKDSEYECEFVNDCGVDVKVRLSSSSKYDFKYKGEDNFDLLEKASKKITYTLQKVFNIFDIRSLLWEIKATVDGEEKVAHCLVPVNAKVVITKRAAGVCAEIYVYGNLTHKAILISVIYLY